MDWHQRFQQQATWTASVRQYLAGQASLHAMQRVLEVGCGTGAITHSLHRLSGASIFGLDFNYAYLQTALDYDPSTRFCDGDARRLPFPDGAFDAVVCHFFLLWVPAPAEALQEMARAARPGGAVIAFAEPDYGGRIDYPPPLDDLGQMQTRALRDQGAQPHTGRKLRGLFHAAGLRDVETGVLGGQWKGMPSKEEIQLEWQTLESDLSGSVDPAQLDRLRSINDAAWKTGQRMLFVPTFYALGRK